MEKIINLGPSKDGITPSLACRFPPDQRQEIKQFAAGADVSEAEAVRQLVRMAFDGIDEWTKESVIAPVAGGDEDGG